MTHDPSPWAGDAIPASTGPSEIVWDLGAPEPPPPRPPSVRPGRTWVIAGAVTAIGLVGVALLLLWPSSDPSAIEGSADDSSRAVTPTTLGTLPQTETTAPATTASPQTTVRSDPADTPLPAVMSLEVPDQIASGIPTEIVALTSFGQLVNIDTVTGTATTIDLDVSSRRGQSAGDALLVVSPDAVMVATGAGSILVVSDEADVPVTIDRDDFVFDSSTPPVQVVPFGWVDTADGGFEFVVIAVEQSSGRQREWLVDTEGNVALALAQRSGNFSTPVFAQGTRFLNDAGGAYRVDPDGSTQRVSDGEIIASSASRILLRECDATRFCTSVLRDHDGSNVASVNLPAAFSPTFFGASLAPDASAIVAPGPSFGGDRTVSDLTTGTTTTYTDQRLGPFGHTWAADSSGEFSLTNGTGLVFLDRATGDEIAFGDELGEVQTVAVRVSGPS